MGRGCALAVPVVWLDAREAQCRVARRSSRADDPSTARVDFPHRRFLPVDSMIHVFVDPERLVRVDLTALDG